jgi:hypothetical protein
VVVPGRPIRRRDTSVDRGCGTGARAVADTDEALRQDVQEKASEEFIDVERQRTDLAPVPVVLPSKGDGVGGDGDQRVVWTPCT